MNRKGFLPAIPLVWWAVIAVLGLGTASYVGAFGSAKIGESCLVPPRPCEYGTACVSGTCQPTVSGWFDRIIGQFSLQKILCGNAGILGQPFCQITVPLISALLLMLVFGILAIIITKIKEAVYIAVLLGLILGIGLSAFFSLYWWIVLIVAAVIGYFSWWFLK